MDHSDLDTKTPCKAYNPKACKKHCQTYEEALNVDPSGQCCMYCFNGKHKNSCSDCNLEVVDNFAKKLISNQVDLPSEYAEVIDKHFWELLSD